VVYEKITQSCQNNIQFLWSCTAGDEDKCILSLANRRKALTIVSLTAGIISPIHCSTILGW
jgi:hypothetical protein